MPDNATHLKELFSSAAQLSSARRGLFVQAANNGGKGAVGQGGMD
jgi:hypothetical protein